MVMRFFLHLHNLNKQSCTHTTILQYYVAVTTIKTKFHSIPINNFKNINLHKPGTFVFISFQSCSCNLRHGRKKPHLKEICEQFNKSSKNSGIKTGLYISVTVINNMQHLSKSICIRS